MSSVDDLNSLSSSSLLVSQDDGCSSDDAPLNDSGGEADNNNIIPSSHQRNIYGWQHVEHLLEDGSRLPGQKLDNRSNGQRVAAVQQRRQSSSSHGAHTRKDSESSGSLPNDLMAIPSMIAPPSLGRSENKRFKHHAKFDHPGVRQRNHSFKRKDSESSDDFLGGNGPKKSLRENDLMAIPSMIAPPKPSPRRRSEFPQQRQPPRPSPLPKHPGRKARSFVSPRDRRRSAGKYKQTQQQNNTVEASSRNNIQLRPENHLSIDTMASVTSSHEESQSAIASPQHLPRVNTGTLFKTPQHDSTLFKTPQFASGIDFIDTQSQYKTVEEAISEGMGGYQSVISEGMGNYQSEMFPPLSPEKSVFSHATEASESPPKSLFSYWLSPPLNKNRKYSTSDEDDSTFDGLSTLYSSMIPPDLGSPVRQLQTADDLEFHPRQFDDLMNSPDNKWPNSVDLVSRCPESPITPRDQLLHGHLYNNYPGRNSTLTRTTEYDNSFPDLPHRSSIIPDEIEEGLKLEAYPPQNNRPTNVEGRKKKSVAIKKTKLKSASTRQHPSRKWEFDDLGTVSSDSVDSSPRTKSNTQSSTIENSVRPGKRRWKFEELLESNNDDAGMSPSAELNDNSLLTYSVESDRKGMLDKQDKVIIAGTPGKRKWKFEELLASPDDGESSRAISVEGKRKWKFEELLASPDDGESSRASSVEELNNNILPSESGDLVHAEDMNEEENVDNLITPGRRKWKFEELLASNNDEENSGVGPFVELSGTFAQQESIDNTHNTTPVKRKWKFEELLASNDDGNTFVRMDNKCAQSDSDDSILNIVLDKQNGCKSSVTRGKRRWKFEDLLASNDDQDEESSSARLSATSVGNQSEHLYKEIDHVQSLSAEINEAELHEIITVFQSHVRGVIVRQSYQRCHDAATIIQKCVRAHNLNKVRQWEEAIAQALKTFPATEFQNIRRKNTSSI